MAFVRLIRSLLVFVVLTGTGTALADDAPAPAAAPTESDVGAAEPDASAREPEPQVSAHTAVQSERHESGGSAPSEPPAAAPMAAPTPSDTAEPGEEEEHDDGDNEPEGYVSMVADFGVSGCVFRGGGIRTSTSLVTIAGITALTLNFDIKGHYCDTHEATRGTVHNLTFPLSAGAGYRVMLGPVSFELRAAFTAILGAHLYKENVMGYDVPHAATSSLFLPMFGFETTIDVGPIGFGSGAHLYLIPGNTSLFVDAGLTF